jgi:hypothetical protein
MIITNLSWYQMEDLENQNANFGSVEQGEARNRKYKPKLGRDCHYVSIATCVKFQM